MSATESDTAESSRAHQKPEPEPEQPGEEVPPPPTPSWVVLASTVEIIPNDDALLHRIPPCRDILLPSPLHDPPRPCEVSLYPHIAPDTEYTAAHAYIHATDRSGRFLLRVIQRIRGGFYLCDAHNHSASRLPAFPANGLNLGLRILPGRSIGLIPDPDPHRPGHYMLVQLQPRGTTTFPNDDLLLYYVSFNTTWRVKVLAPSPGSKPFPADDHGVLTHAGMLWWVALTHGLFFCDPFPMQPRLNIVPFPGVGDHQHQVVVDHAIPLEQRRSVRLSEGKLRFVDIRGLATDPTGDNPLSVCLFTLDDAEPGNQWTWTLDHMVPFSEIWAHQSYINSGLPQPQNPMPHIAFVNPENHRVVYFFLDSWIFGVDLSDRHVEDYHQCSINHDRLRDLKRESSRPTVDAWELLPPTPGDDPSSPDVHKYAQSSPTPNSIAKDDASRTWCEVNKEKHRLSIERVTSWLKTTALTNQEDEGQSSSASEPEPGSTI